MKINIDLKKLIGKGYASFWRSKARYVVVKGGRGSKKSFTVAFKLIYSLLEDPRNNILVVRKVAETNRDSTYSQLKKCIDLMGVSDLFYFKKSPLEIIRKDTGQKVLFRGADDMQKLTSIQVEKGYLTKVWIEEAYQLENENEFNKLDMSIRGKLPEGLHHQLYISFNPWNTLHWLYNRFFKPYDNGTDTEDLENKGLHIYIDNEDMFVASTNYKINEFLGASDIKLFDNMKKQSMKRYLVEGLGHWGANSGLVFDNFEEKEFDIKALTSHRYAIRSYGIDWGWSPDPTAFIALVLDENTKTIWIYDEFYQQKMTAQDVAKKLYGKAYNFANITADSSNQGMIEELKQLGIKGIHPAKKGQDSVIYGIQWLSQYKIYIHPRCINTLKEFNSYSWKCDRTGKSTGKPEDKNNHLIDEVASM